MNLAICFQDVRRHQACLRAAILLRYRAPKYVSAQYSSLGTAAHAFCPSNSAEVSSSNHYIMYTIPSVPLAICIYPAVFAHILSNQDPDRSYCLGQFDMLPHIHPHSSSLVPEPPRFFTPRDDTSSIPVNRHA